MIKCWCSPSLPLWDELPCYSLCVSNAEDSARSNDCWCRKLQSLPPGPLLLTSPLRLPQGPFVHIASICAAVLSKFMSVFSGVYEVRLRQSNEVGLCVFRESGGLALLRAGLDAEMGHGANPCSPVLHTPPLLSSPPDASVWPVSVQ